MMSSTLLSNYCILMCTLLVSLSTLPHTYSWSSSSVAIIQPTQSSYSSSSSSSSSTQLYSTIDERYYSPATSDHTPNIFDATTNNDNTSAGATSEELEIAAQNYGYGTSSNGVGAMQKITLTRWLQAKVQDYPEVSLYSESWWWI